jgi:hypothetical protein
MGTAAAAAGSAPSVPDTTFSPNHVEEGEKGRGEQMGAGEESEGRGADRRGKERSREGKEGSRLPPPRGGLARGRGAAACGTEKMSGEELRSDAEEVSR